jgi:hypothetical protein
LGAGDDVFVFGGFVIPGAGPGPLLEPQNDGAIYNLRSGRWRVLPDAPFTSALYQASGVWSGEEVFVLGTPCGPTSTDKELARCKPGGLQMAAYSPSSDTWRLVEGVEAPDGAGFSEGFPVETVGLGWVAGEAVFSVPTADPEQQLLFVDPADGTLRWAARLDGSDTVCATGDAVVAVQSGQVSAEGAITAPNPTAVAESLRTFELEPATHKWVKVDETPKPASAGAMFERVYCSGDQLVYLPVMPPPIGFDAGALRWDAARTEWTAIPPLGGVEFSGDATIAESDGALVIWVLGSDSLLILPSGAATWTTKPTPTGARAAVTLSATDGLVLVDETAREGSPTRLSFGVLDPERYAAAR